MITTIATTIFAPSRTYLIARRRPRRAPGGAEQNPVVVRRRGEAGDAVDPLPHSPSPGMNRASVGWKIPTRDCFACLATLDLSCLGRRRRRRRGTPASVPACVSATRKRIFAAMRNQNGKLHMLGVLNQIAKFCMHLGFCYIRKKASLDFYSVFLEFFFLYAKAH